MVCKGGVGRRRVDAAEDGASVDEEVYDRAPQGNRWEFKGRQVGRGVPSYNAGVGGKWGTVREGSGVADVDAKPSVGVAPDDEALAGTGWEHGEVVVVKLIGPFAHDRIGASCFERAPAGR